MLRSGSQKLKKLGISPLRLKLSPKRVETPTHSPRITESVYYNIWNLTTKQLSDKGPLWNHFLPYIKRMCDFDYQQVHDLFTYVITENGWDEEDEIIAKGDHGDIIRWSDYSYDSNTLAGKRRNSN